MSWETILAKELKKRDNKKKVGAVIGTVLSLNPLKIGILNNKVILNKDNCYLCSSVIEKYNKQADIEIKPYTVSVTGVVGTPHGAGSISSLSVLEDKKNYDTIIKFKNILNVNDKVLVISTENNQNYFIVDKIVGVSK